MGFVTEDSVEVLFRSQIMPSSLNIMLAKDSLKVSCAHQCNYLPEVTSAAKQQRLTSPELSTGVLDIKIQAAIPERRADTVHSDNGDDGVDAATMA